MTPEDRVREFWEQRGTPLSVASITKLVRAAENDALERAATAVERELADWQTNGEGHWAVHLPTLIRSAASK